MKLPIKYMAILVVTSLTAIFAYQAYWLVNMYQTNKVQTKTAIQNAIRNADHIEIFMRADSISEENEKERNIKSNANSSGEVSFSASFERIDKPADSKTTIKKNIKENDSTQTESQKEAEVEEFHGLPGENQIGDSYTALEAMAIQLQRGLHAAIDFETQNIRVAVFDSILNSDLVKSGLDIKHYTRIVEIENDSTLFSSLTADVDTTKMEKYELVYDIHEKYAYYVYTEPTGQLALKQMSGILLTSFLIVVILGCSFWFLIHTILKQKTLDEIKTDFTNNVTHELKTPIAVAYAANDALLNFNQAEDKKQRDKYLNIAQEQLQKLSGLVEQILSMSMEKRKTFQLKMEEVEVAPLIFSLVEQHKLKYKKTVHFNVEIDPQSITIMTDRAHFSNIISNLIDNAIKYSPEEAWIDIRCLNRNDQTEISVSDRGIGISAERQKYIFDKFYRVPTGNLHNVKGYGLGLYYVKTMVDKLGVDIKVKSEPGKGSCFTIYNL